METIMLITIDIESIYGKVAKLAKIDKYLSEAIEQAGAGNEIVLTGQGPVWLYLLIAHALHGKAKKLYYDSPASGRVLIFDHDPL
jgi:hypothetical protein